MMEQVLQRIGPIVTARRAEIRRHIDEKPPTDEQMRRLAGIVHPWLPWYVRLFLRRRRVEQLFISHRPRVMAIVREKL